MSESLEMLERVNVRLNTDLDRAIWNKQYNIIKQALLKAQKEHKALEILKEHIKFEDRGIETYTDDLKNLVTKFLIRLESKDTGAKFHIHLDTKEEINTLEEAVKQ